MSDAKGLAARLRELDGDGLAQAVLMMENREAILAALEDAERYRWLRGEVQGPHIPMAQVVWKRNNVRDCTDWTNLSDAKTLDEHIDATRKEGA